MQIDPFKVDAAILPGVQNYWGEREAKQKLQVVDLCVRYLMRWKFILESFSKVLLKFSVNVIFDASTSRGSSSIRAGAPNDNFRKNICSEDDLRSRIFETFVVKFLACVSLLGFSNI